MATQRSSPWQARGRSPCQAGALLARNLLSASPAGVMAILLMSVNSLLGAD